VLVEPLAEPRVEVLAVDIGGGPGVAVGGDDEDAVHRDSLKQIIE
jgi:hypothetical protein